MSNYLAIFFHAVLGLDPSQDTPIELLHTILLGVIKYVWSMLNSSWSDTQRNLFAIRLQSTDIDGLTIPPIRAGYMTQYRNNLIGKHFKALMQAWPFHVHGLVTPSQFALVKSVSALSSLLWVHEIPDMEKYLVCYMFGAIYNNHSTILPRLISIPLSPMHLTPLETQILRKSLSRSSSIF